MHLKRIRQNAQAFKNLTKTKLCAVVKADAYGHGSVEVASALVGVADCFAVALIDEGLSIRTAVCGKDILVLTPPLCKADAYTGIKNGFILTVSDLKTAKLITSVCREYNLSARVHLKVNTGMNRYGAETSGKFGYTRVGILAAASSAQSLRDLRSKYSRLFIIVDGADYPNANAKNCAAAFDKFGHGAACCVGNAIVDAWKQEEGEDYLAPAVAAAERMKKNFGRYVTIL